MRDRQRYRQVERERDLAPEDWLEVNKCGQDNYRCILGTEI